MSGALARTGTLAGGRRNHRLPTAGYLAATARPIQPFVAAGWSWKAGFRSLTWPAPEGAGWLAGWLAQVATLAEVIALEGIVHRTAARARVRFAPTIERRRRRPRSQANQHDLWTLQPPPSRRWKLESLCESRRQNQPLERIIAYRWMARARLHARSRLKSPSRHPFRPTTLEPAPSRL